MGASTPSSTANARLTLALCAAAAVFEGFDNQSIGVAMPRIALEFALSTSEKSLILSAAPFGLFLGAAIGGRVADFLGSRRTLIVSLLLFGLFSLLTAQAGTADALLATRLLTGLGLGGALPNFIALSSEAALPQRRLTATTIVMAGMPFGGAIAAFIALGEGAGWGWRSIFYVGGAGPVLIASLMWLLLRDPAGTKTRDPMKQVADIPTVLFGKGQAPTTLSLWVAFFFTQLVLLLMLNWLPTLIAGLGFSRLQASWASIWFNLAGSFCSVLLARMHAGSQRRLWVVLTYAGMTAALAAVPWVGQTFWLAAIACAFAGVFIIGAQLILFALAPLYYERGVRGTGVGAAVSVGRLGSVVGPLFAGALIAAGGTSGAVLLAIVPFVVVAGGGALALTTRRQSGMTAIAARQGTHA